MNVFKLQFGFLLRIVDSQIIDGLLGTSFAERKVMLPVDIYLQLSCVAFS